MMENHSYDNYLGMLADRPGGFELDAEGKPIATNPRSDGSLVDPRVNNARVIYSHHAPSSPEATSW
jgi:hypothetical protein